MKMELTPVLKIHCPGAFGVMMGEERINKSNWTRSERLFVGLGGRVVCTRLSQYLGQLLSYLSLLCTSKLRSLLASKLSPFSDPFGLDG